MTNSDHLPPQDLEAERSLLGSLMLSPAAFEEVSAIIRASDFYSDAHRRIWRSYAAIAHSSTPADDVVLLGHELEKRGDLAEIGGANYLAQILETVPHAAHAAHYARIVRDAADRRRIIDIGLQLCRGAHDKNREIPEMVSSAESGLHAILESSAESEAVDVNDALIEVFETLDAEDPPGISTGWRDLDWKLNGGFRPGALYIVAARPSVGKTAFAGNAALNVAVNGAGVMIFSVEQPRQELTERLLSARSGIPVAKIQLRTVDASERDRLTEAANELGILPIAIDHGSTRTVTQIAAIARLRKRRQGLSLVIVDYLQLLTPEDQRVSREQQVATMSRGLKCLARDLNVPVIALCQLNRSIEARENKRPKLSDLRDSGSIEQDADAVLFLDRPATWKDGADESEAKLIVAKNRNGATGEIQMFWKATTMQFHAATRGEF